MAARPRGARRYFLPVVGSVALASTLVPIVGGATVRDQLPDLRMGSPSALRVTTLRSGRRLLRFTSMIVNAGPGPFVVRASRTSTGKATMTVRQRIRRSDGSWRSVTTRAIGRYAGDGHDHWHVQRVASYELFRLNGSRLKTGAKIGFCFFDVRRASWLSTSVRTRRYRESTCGRRRSLTASMGLSNGWADVYPWDFAYQWIDISGIPDGSYRVCVTADPLERFVETRDGNNQVWTNIRIRDRRVILRGSGRTACVPGDGASLRQVAERIAPLPDVVPRFVVPGDQLAYCVIATPDDRSI